MVRDPNVSYGGQVNLDHLLDPTADARQAVRDAAGAAPPVAAAAGVYDRTCNVYNLKPAHLRRFRARLAGAETGVAECRVAAMGTSIAAGQGVTDKATQSWPSVLRVLLRAAGIPGTGGPVLAHLGDSGIDPRWTYTGTWAKFSPGAQYSDRTALYQANTAGAAATFASIVSGTVAEVWYSNASAPFTVSIDGAAAVTVTPTGGTNIVRYQVTGLTDATHTIAITRTGASLYLAAACVRAAVGVSIGNFGSGGATVNNYQQTTLPYDLRSFALSWAPHLVTVGFMTNEAIQAVTADTYAARLQSLIAAVVNAGADLLLIAEPSASGYDLSDYRTALYRLADSNDLPVLDMFDRWGSYGAANSLGLMADGAHPAAPGYRDYGRSVVAALLATA